MLNELADLIDAGDIAGFRAKLALLAIAEVEGWAFDNGDTLLEYAICEGKLHFVEVLLEAGINPAREDEHGGNALWFALSQDAPVEIVRALLAAGVDPRTSFNGDGYDVLTAAVECGAGLELLELLLAHGADANETNNGSMTPLIQACLRRDAAAVELLLRHGGRATLGADGMSPAEAARDDARILALLRQALRDPHRG